MFNIGEKIIYGTEGVFVVSEYARSPIDKNDDRIFYILKPAYGSESNIIYTPADNTRVKMRSVMSREEALGVIANIPRVPLLFIEQEKKRRNAYRDAMSEGETTEYISIIKTIHYKREDCIKHKKRLSESDAEYEKKAKYCLYGELAVSLGISFDEVEGYILNMLGASEVV